MVQENNNSALLFVFGASLGFGTGIGLELIVASNK